MTTAYNGRIFNAVASEGKPFTIVWDAQVFDWDLWVIPKGSKNLDAALDFLAFSTATEQLANCSVAVENARKSNAASKFFEPFGITQRSQSNTCASQTIVNGLPSLATALKIRPL